MIESLPTERFFVIASDAPSDRVFTDYDKARSAAEALSTETKGTRFFVMESIAMVAVNDDPQWDLVWFGRPSLKVCPVCKHNERHPLKNMCPTCERGAEKKKKKLAAANAAKGDSGG